MPAYPIEKTDSEWKAQLAANPDAEPLAYHVTRKAATERPFTGKYEGCEQAGVYRCICCGNALFESDDKYHSGSGWPSFFTPISEHALGSSTDYHLGYARSEIHCSQCGAHVGHVFPDGPAPTGLRYCCNSAALHLQVSQSQTMHILAPQAKPE
jgi:peptide-methionine (R)-S-oxide reductase